MLLFSRSNFSMITTFLCLGLVIRVAGSQCPDMPDGSSRDWLECVTPDDQVFCYYVTDSNGTHGEQKQACKELHPDADFAVLNTKQTHIHCVSENNATLGLPQTGEGVWIGLNRIPPGEAGTWVWLDNVTWPNPNYDAVIEAPHFVGWNKEENNCATLQKNPYIEAFWLYRTDCSVTARALCYVNGSSLSEVPTIIEATTTVQKQTTTWEIATTVSETTALASSQVPSSSPQATTERVTTEQKPTTTQEITTTMSETTALASSQVPSTSPQATTERVTTVQRQTTTQEMAGTVSETTASVKVEDLRHKMIKSPSSRTSKDCLHKCIELMFCVSVKSCTDVAHGEVKCELKDNAHSATCEQLQKDAKDCRC